MRRNRKLKKGATYLCIGTINRFRDELVDIEVKEIMLDVLQECKCIYSYILFDFSVQNNCIKFIIKPTGNSNLSSIMQWVLSQFAVRFNKYFKLRGHVFYDRFKSEIIETVEEVKKNMKKLLDFPVANKFVRKAVDYIYCGAYYLKRKVHHLVEPLTYELFVS
jgi:putative transposase